MKKDLESCIPLRLKGLAMAWSDGDLLIWSPGRKIECQLNQTAALVWLMCDGQFGFADIENELRRRFPDDAEHAGDNLLEVLGMLCSKNLLEVVEGDLAFAHAFGRSNLRPTIKVAFCDFWEGFDTYDNYFLRMLSTRVDVIVVEPESNEANIVFHSNCKGEGFSSDDVDRSRCFKILYHRGEGTPDFDRSDLVFSEHEGSGYPEGVHRTLPLWSLFFDWDGYRNTGLVLPEEHGPSSPEATGRYMFDAVFGDLFEVRDVFDLSRIRQPRFDPARHAGASVLLSPEGERVKLTIGMAVYDDYDGAYFTLMALCLYHQEVLKDAEILVVDNHPDGPSSSALQKLVEDVSHCVRACRYLPYGDIQGSTVKDAVFRHARGGYVLCVDSHVLVAPGAIERLVAFLDDNPECAELLQGPLLRDNLQAVLTHFKPGWSGGMYGTWGSDERGRDPDGEPFEIDMQGAGLLACRKEAWPGFNPRFMGFGGEEGYIHEKFRQAGRRTLCLPFLRWTHRFYRQEGPPYPNLWKHRIRNYLLGHAELGLDMAPVQDHFTELLGRDVFESLQYEARSELLNPFTFFDRIYCLTSKGEEDRWTSLEKSFHRFGMAHRVQRFERISLPHAPHLESVAAHRRIVGDALLQGLDNVLIIEDGAVFVEDCLAHMERSLNELGTRPWNIFHMGRHRLGELFPKASGCSHLQDPGTEPVCTQSVAYSSRIFNAMVEDLPDEIEAAGLSGEGSFEAQGLAAYHQRHAERYLAYPIVSSGVVL